MVNHKYILVMCCLLIVFAVQDIQGWQFPVLFVSDPSCKQLDREKHNKACKIEIKDIDTPDEKKQMSPLSQLVYSVLRNATYTHQRDSGKGGHAGVDIVSAKGTPIYAIGNGEVIRSGTLFGFGESITIKHMYQDSYIYSNYSHLDTRDVLVGDFVTQGAQIGTMGNSGNSSGAFGNHLEFQITTPDSPSHPYGYGDCNASYIDIVNQGLCQDKLKQATKDPLAFFAEQQPPKQDIPTPYRTRKTEHTAAPEIPKQAPTKELLLVTHQSPTLKTATLPTLTRKKSSSLPQITLPQEIDTIGEITLSTPGYLIQTNIKQFGDKLTIGKISKLNIKISDITTQSPISGKLDEPVTIEYDRAYISILPNKITRIYKGTKDLFIRTNKKGTTPLTIKYGDRIVGQHMVTIE